MTGTGEYWAAVAELAAIAGAVGFGAVRLRRALLPTWLGAPARLVEVVLALAQVLAVAQVLGAAHVLKEAPFVDGCVGVGLAVALLAQRLPRPWLPETPAAPRPGRVALTVTAAIAGLLVVNWAIGVEESLHGGMYGFDTMWYHGPFAAQFAQSGSVTDIHFSGAYGPLVWFYPQSSELLHAGGILLFGNDFLSPLMNLGWLGLGLLAAWCIGRPLGAGPITVAVAALVLGSHPWLSSQPGNAYNDVAALALLMAMVAILVNGRALSGRVDWRVLSVAGVAAGLAIGIKLTVAAPIAAIVVGLIALAPAGTRRLSALALLAPMAATGSFWYLRNLFLVGNPLPSLDLGVLPAPVLPPHRSDFSVAHYLTDGDVWRHFFLPGLHDALGVVWPVVLAAAAAGAVLAVWRGGTPLIRLFGAAAIVAALVYVITPYGAQGPEGHPRNFEGNLRYAAPALVLGMIALATHPFLVGTRRRLGVLSVLAVIFLIADKPLDARHGPYLFAAVAITVGLVGVPFAARELTRRGVGWLPLGGAITALAAIVLLAGHRQERVYIESRYAVPSGVEQNRAIDAAFRWVRDVRDARIATNVFRQYGLYGTDLSNRVTFIGRRGPHGAFASIDNCPEWRSALNAGDYDYVVPAPTYRDAAGRPHPSPPYEWTRTDPAARKLPGPAPVFEVGGRFDSRAC
jgi:hypothetical protein